jgi:hypothetical protein
MVAEALLDKKTRVCSTIQTNRGLPSDLLGETKELKKDEPTFQRKNDILLQVWKDKREMRMISTTHKAKSLLPTKLTGEQEMSSSLTALFNTTSTIHEMSQQG